MSLNDKAMIVTLNISSWTARKLDRKISKNIAKQYHADEEQSGNFNKQLLTKNDLEYISKAVSTARTFHIANTLPWGNNNDRLLPTKNYFEYMKTMQAIKDKFEIAVSDFIQKYPPLREEQRDRLGDMFDVNEYPDPSIISKKYKFEIGFSPVPDANDFRVEITESEKEEIKKAIEKRVQQSTKTMTDGLWNKLFTKVEKLNERLSKKGNHFQDSLIGNIKDVCELLPRLNVMDDPKLQETLEEVKVNLASIVPQNLREDMGVRSETKDKAEAILEKMRGYIS